METKESLRGGIVDRTAPERSDATLRYTGYVGAALAFASQLFHLWVLQEEFLFRPLSGGLVFLVAICQGVLAASLLFGPGRWMLRFGILVNVGAVLAWVATRFVGSPGFIGFDRLPVEPLNVAVVIVEMMVVVILVVISKKNHREEGHGYR